MEGQMKQARRRRERAQRYRLLDYLGQTTMPLEAYASLRGEIIERFADRLDDLPWFWAYERGIPDWLRRQPEQGDVRLLRHGYPLDASGAAAHLDAEAFARAKADVEEFDATEAAYAAVMAGRRMWLANHGFEHSQENDL
jgi:hypothetical protein